MKWTKAFRKNAGKEMTVVSYSKIYFAGQYLPIPHIRPTYP